MNKKHKVCYHCFYYKTPSCKAPCVNCVPASVKNESSNKEEAT
jgi:hypothetical protein